METHSLSSFFSWITVSNICVLYLHYPAQCGYFHSPPAFKEISWWLSQLKHNNHYQKNESCILPEFYPSLLWYLEKFHYYSWNFEGLWLMEMTSVCTMAKLVCLMSLTCKEIILLSIVTSSVYLCSHLGT